MELTAMRDKYDAKRNGSATSQPPLADVSQRAYNAARCCDGNTNLVTLDRSNFQMNNFLRRCCTGLFCAGLLVSAQAQEFHFGFVKTDRIFKESNAAKTAQTKLEQEFSKREKDIAAQNDLLKS